MALAKLVAEDPSFARATRSGNRPDHHRRTGANCISTSRSTSLKRDLQVDANIGAPQVAYREKITQRVKHEYTHKKQTGGSGQFAQVKIIAEPTPSGTPFEFVNEVVGGTVPKEYIPGVEKGLDSVLGSGVLAGFPVVDLKVTLIDGRYHDVNSSALAFEIASRAALEEAMLRARPVLHRADHEGRGGDGGGIHRLRHRRSQLTTRPHSRQDVAATPTSSTQWCRSPTCSATSTTCDRCRRGARHSRCNSTTTLNCRRTCPPKCRRSSLKSRGDKQPLRI